MEVDDPAILNIMQRSMVARIATLSRNGRPSITPLYFVYLNGNIWLGTVDWTLAARSVLADPRVSVLFEVEQGRSDHRVLRIRGRASVQTDQEVQRRYRLGVARKYFMTLGGIRNTLTHMRQLPLIRNYHAQGAEKGQSCVIEIASEHAEFIAPLVKL